MSPREMGPGMGLPAWLLCIEACNSERWLDPGLGTVCCIVGVPCRNPACGRRGATRPEAYDAYSLSRRVKSAHRVAVGVGEKPFEPDFHYQMGEWISRGYGDALLVRATADTALVWRRYLVREAPNAEWPTGRGWQ